MTMSTLQVLKRNGELENVSYDKITQRIELLTQQHPPLSNDINPTLVVQKVIAGIYDKISTSNIDELAAEICASMTVVHIDYAKLASRIVVSNLHKNTPNSLVDAMQICYDNINPKTDNHAPQISKETLKIIRKNSEELEKVINYDKDFNYDYFGMKTLMRAYLKRAFIRGKDTIIERPQHMLMRVSVGIWKNNIPMVIETYNRMSNKEYTHATPTLFNSGTTQSQLSSCFLIANEDDSLEGITNTFSEVAKISAKAGGIGVSISNLRAKGSYIRGSGGTSNGLMPYLRNMNEWSRYWDQGGGKRKGSFAMYVEPWHADIFTFLEIKKNHGKEEMRARDLFPALWIPDLFMERVENDDHWTLMCPNECPGLFDVYGEQFNKLYHRYESQGKGKRVVRARELWEEIVKSQIETGTPYMMYKDSCNYKSNQKNLGTIRSSNLCTEIVEYSDDKETAVCNLISISLKACIRDIGDELVFDHNKLFDITRHGTLSLDQVIDSTDYPTEKARRSNKRHRPLGIGVQGLADVFALLRVPFDSEQAKELNKRIFETIYYAALDTSCEMAKKKGTYESYKGSPASQGLLQYDLWGKTEEVENSNQQHNWRLLKRKIKQYGLRNSLLLAPMPTASTSQILGNNECFEPFTSNLYVRRTLSGEFIVVNQYLLNDLMNLGLWDDSMKNKLMSSNGSIQSFDEIPQSIRDLYKDAYELSMKTIIDMAADRAIFIDQSQSMNLFMTNASVSKITSMHFYGWKSGLKTGMYYLRTKAAVDAIKFTVDKSSLENKLNGESIDPDEFKQMIEQSKNGEDCLMCGS